MGFYDFSSTANGCLEQMAEKLARDSLKSTRDLVKHARRQATFWIILKLKNVGRKLRG